MDKVVAGRSAIFYRDFGVTADGPVPVRVYDGAGVELTALATNATEDATQTGLYSFGLEPLTTLDTYSIRWSPVFSGVTEDHTSYFAVVGGTYFTISEARALRTNNQEQALDDADAYPDGEIIDGREAVEELFESERVCDRAFVRRGRRVTLKGTGANYLPLPDKRNVGAPYSAAWVDSSGTETAFTAEELADLVVGEFGVLRRRSGGHFPAHYHVKLHYPHGEFEVPGPIKRAALLKLKHQLIPSGISDRAQSYTDETGTLALAQADTKTRYTGIPEVDSILYRFADHWVGVA